MELSVKVLGSGCAKCGKLAENAQAAVAQLGMPATVEKVTDVAQFERYGVLFTPALVVNEKVVSAGRVPSPAQIVSLLTTALAE